MAFANSKPGAYQRLQHPAAPIAISAAFLAVCVGIAWICHAFELHATYLPPNQWMDGLTRRQARLAIGQPWLALALGIVVGLCCTWISARGIARAQARFEADAVEDSVEPPAPPRNTAGVRVLIPLGLGLIAAWNLEVSLLVFLPAIMIPQALNAIPLGIIFRQTLARVNAERGSEAAHRLRNKSRRRAVVVYLFSATAVMATMYSLAKNYDTLVEQREIGLVLKGAALNATEGVELAAELERKPDSAALRAEALGYFRRNRSPAGQAAHVAQVFWIIENRPGAPIAGLPEAQLHHREFDGAYAKGSEIWEGQTREHPDNAEVWANAAYYHAFHDKGRAMAYITKALGIQPYRRDWQNVMAYLQSPRPDDEAAPADEQPQTLLQLPLGE